MANLRSFQLAALAAMNMVVHAEPGTGKVARPKRPAAPQPPENVHPDEDTRQRRRARERALRKSRKDP